SREVWCFWRGFSRNLLQLTGSRGSAGAIGHIFFARYASRSRFGTMHRLAHAAAVVSRDGDSCADRTGQTPVPHAKGSQHEHVPRIAPGRVSGIGVSSPRRLHKSLPTAPVAGRPALPHFFQSAARISERTATGNLGTRRNAASFVTKSAATTSSAVAA